MVKRKYLIFYIFLITSQNILASPWLPDIGKYKYSISTSKIDKGSKILKKQRVGFYIKTENLIDDFLLYRENLFNEMNAEIEMRIRMLPTVFTAESRRSQITEITQMVSNKFNQKIAFIDVSVKSLKNTLCQMHSYQDQEQISSTIEYGATDQISFGINALYQENRFVNSKYTDTKDHSQTKSGDIFLKYKLFQNNNYIISVQPKILIKARSNYHQDTFQDLSILLGFSKKKGSLEFFTESGIAIGGGVSSNTSKNKYYTFALSEGVKLPYSFTLVNFTKFYIRRNYGYIYKKSIYKQLSIAKTFNFNNLRVSNLSIQLGYFWDTSLKAKNFSISGAVFSLWFEV